MKGYLKHFVPVILAKSMILVMVFGVVFILISCSKPSSDAGGYKTELNIAFTAQPPTLDTHMTVSQASLVVAKNIFEQLYTLNADYVPTPDLAESLEISPDGLVYTFKIRQGVKFHNGKELTADDVVASMNRWIEFSSRARTLLGGSIFEKIDNYTVKLTVPRATQDVLLVLAMHSSCSSIYPKEIVESAGAEGISEYIGTGPYRCEEWRQDQFIHLVKYDNYQPLSTPSSGFSGRKEAPTQNLYFHFVTDHATRIAGIKTGEYDVVEDVPVENYDELVAAPGITLYSRESGSLNLFFNTNEGTLRTVAMRQAVLAAIDAQEIMTASFTGPEHFTLDPGYMNINQPQWAVKAGAEYYNQANPEKARRLAREAGYNGETIVLLTTRDYLEMYSATLVVQDLLRQAGFRAEVSNFDFPTFLQTKDDYSKWDIFITMNGYNLTPPQILAVNPSWAGFNAPEVAPAIDAIRTAASAEDASREWGKLQQFMYEYASSTALGHYKDYVATTDKVTGFVLFSLPVYWNAKVEK
jgi:peptide/nickel transport system substrate-binding protein